MSFQRKLKKIIFLFFCTFWLTSELIFYPESAYAYNSADTFCAANAVACANAGIEAVQGTATASWQGTVIEAGAVAGATATVAAGAKLLFGYYGKSGDTPGKAQTAGLSPGKVNSIRGTIATNYIGRVKATFQTITSYNPCTPGDPVTWRQAWNVAKDLTEYQLIGQGVNACGGYRGDGYLYMAQYGQMYIFSGYLANVGGTQVSWEAATLSDWPNIDSSIRSAATAAYASEHPEAFTPDAVTDTQLTKGGEATIVDFPGTVIPFPLERTTEPSPSPSPSESPSPAPYPSPGTSPGGDPNPSPGTSPGGDPNPNPNPNPNPSPSSSPNPSPGPSPGTGTSGEPNYQSKSFTGEFFVTHAIKTFKDKFPFDIFGTASSGATSNECPKYTFFDVEMELCMLKDAILALKIPVQMGICIIFYQRL